MRVLRLMNSEFEVVRIIAVRKVNNLEKEGILQISQKVADTF